MKQKFQKCYKLATKFIIFVGEETHFDKWKKIGIIKVMNHYGNFF